MTTRPALFLAALVALSAAPLAAQHDHDMAMAADSGPPPLYQNLGHLHRAIRTTSPVAQQYFDQGLRLTYAFNHAEAVRSFQHATELDSTCAICWWGIANALGPNINLPMAPEANGRAFDAIQRAVALAGNGRGDRPVASTRMESPRNRALIEATSTRYAEHPPANRSPLDSAYATKLAAATKQFPDDPDIGALYGEAMLDLRPWNQWQHDGTPQPGTLDAVAALERVLARNPGHPGACHFYIHAVEGSTSPERALPCAQRLATLMPGAGHLVHMPAHIALRLGRYQEAINHNQHAVHADEQYLDGPHTESIYGVAYKAHNWHFLSVAAAFAGQSKLAIDAARETRNSIPIEVAKQVPPVEYWLTIPYFALVRFSQWDEMLAEPAPDSALHYVTAMWHYGRGMAAAGKRDLALAHADLEQLAAIRAATPPDAMAGSQQAGNLLGMAEENLLGAIAAHSGEDSGAVTHFEKAVEFDQALAYDEPPPSYTPPRELLGMELLRQHRPADAAAVFRADLKDHRENGWSLFGLSLALKGEKHPREAAQVEARYKRAWQGADVQVREVRF